jgi:hypothetical protein
VVVGDTDVYTEASMAGAYMGGCDKGGKVGAGWLMVDGNKGSEREANCLRTIFPQSRV